MRAFPRLNLAAALAALAVLAVLVSASPAGAQADQEKRITDSAAVLETLVRAPDQGIPEDLLERAEAIVVIPSLVKGGFIIGAQHGRGVMSVRDRNTNKWSAPGFVALTGGSIGWQIGVQAVDLVLLVMNREGVKDLLDNEFKLGANASVAAGPVGRQGEASTDASLNAQILAYSRAKGLFAGLSLEGASLRVDRDANKDFYGTSISTDEMVRGITKTTPAGSQWTATLARLAPAASTR
ncbi:MAG TPA: lipid-binding SYLF domain-containing protein [Vicinamibacterales bacterium]|jgi:lipid-binding SYLF domain-containing protein|nr:lipid-binding SYLF domain-containing protein [Vicinamibacterales bacterium]